MTMPKRRSLPWLLSAFTFAALLHFNGSSAQGQEAPAADAPAAVEEDLSQIEARLADRYDRLEFSVARVAELSGSTQPRRAALLRQLVAESRNRDVAGQFDKVVAALEQESYSSAIDGQAALETELQKLLELLLQEDRDRQIESERKRIARFLQDVNKLIRLQRGVTGRTEGGEEAAELADDQQRVGDQTKKLGEEIAESEETAEQRSRREQGDGTNGDQGEPSEPKPSESSSGKPKTGGDNKADNKDEKNKADEQRPSKEPQEGAKSDDAESPPSEPGEGSPTPSQGQPSKGQPGKSQPSQGSPSEGQPSPPSEQQDQSQAEQSPEDSGSPTQRAAKRLQQAQQRMEEAKKQLEEAKREGAVKEQEKAVEQLEQAKAELERILRQLREEELERMLVLLEARIRKMLEEQVEIYDETQRLDAAAAKAPEHELEIASGRLARREGLIVREADRALVLLREDGTSVAFPEAIEQARDDMQSIADRLRETKVDLITQGLEEDVIAALEESLAALQQALRDLRDKKGQPPQPGGQPSGEKPLVDRLAELRMIRALQMRVNRRTQQYGAMIEGEQALEEELLEALRELGIRQQKIFQATRDLETKEN
jgi:hypothetical protein